MVVIHDAHCCSMNYTSYDEPRWFGNRRPIFCSGLRELDAVMGSDDILVDKISEAASSISPDFIAVLGSPVPTIVGADMAGIAAEIEARTSIRTFGFSTTGLRYYNRGAGEVMCELIRSYAQPSTPPAPDGVNLLGLTPLDFSDNRNASDLITSAQEHGLRVVASMMMGCTLEHIAVAPSARVNWVTAQSGMAPARLMEQRWGIPWLAALPVGTNGAQPVLAALEERMAGATSGALHASGLTSGDILIVGEQLQCNGLRNALALRGVTGVDVACLFGLDRALALPWDLDVRKERELRALLHTGRYRAVVADPTVERLLKEDDPCVFYRLPLVAISSRLFWHDYKVFQSAELDQMMDQIAADSP